MTLPKAAVLCALLALCTTALPQTPPLVTLPRTLRVPAIDGIITPGEWENATVAGGFVRIATGHPAVAEVRVLACYDARALYCLYECRGEDVGALAGELRPRDAEIWVDSLVELFVAPRSNRPATYWHFMVNHAGAIADELCHSGRHDLAANPDWEAAVGSGAESWWAEVAVPWSSLGLEEVAAGQRLGINFARNAASAGELSSWAHLKGTFHAPDLFGTAVLGEIWPVVQTVKLPGRRTGPATVSALVLSGKRGGRLNALIRSESAPRVRRLSRALLPDPGQELWQRAEIDLLIEPGTESIEVCVCDPRGRLLWRQSALLQLPPVLGRAETLSGELGRLARRTAGTPLSADLPDLHRALAALKQRAAEPATMGDLVQIAEALDAVERRVHDLSLLWASAEPAEGETPGFYVANPCVTQKVQPDSVDAGPQAKELYIAMARGESEPVQLVLCPVLGGLGGAVVTVGDLTGPAGATIPARRVTVNPLGFVRCDKVTPGASLKGWVPDVLLPNRPLDVAIGKRRPVFITVRTTQDDAAGLYTGLVRVEGTTATGRQVLELPLSVRVYDVALPVKSPLRTAFVLWANYRSFGEGTDAESYLEAYIRYSKLMLEHRISPITMWPPEKGGDGEWDFGKTDGLLQALVPLGLTTLNIGGNGTVAAGREVDFARAMAEHLKAAGHWDLHYVYGHDEAPSGALEDLKANYSALVKAVPDLKIMQTGWNPHPALKGLVRIWCPLTAHADLPSVRRAQSEGDQVWWYVCCGPTAPYANLFVDYPGIDHRILGWMTFSRGIEGFLYWGVDVWTGNSGTAEQYDAQDYANWDPNSFAEINGDGYLLYPAADGGGLPSLRLALLRDGFEDHDLFVLLRQMAAGHPEAAAEVARLLDFSGDLIGGLTDYTQHGRDLLERREQVLQMAENLSRVP